MLVDMLPEDLKYVVLRLPRAIRSLMNEHRGLIVGGGFIRDVISGSRANDIDIFGPTKELLSTVAGQLKEKWKGRLFKTDNAITITAAGRIPVQFITRWLYEAPKDVIASFDYSIAQAAVYLQIGVGIDGEWVPVEDEKGKWAGKISARFYADLAAKRLTYLYPDREEDAGGSLMRMQKFLRRGYNIAPEDMAGVIARLMRGIDPKSWMAEKSDQGMAALISAKLREVDPLTMLDQIELASEGKGDGAV